MNYLKSTRGGVGNNIPFSKVVVDGYADDGGLYVPNTYPSQGSTDIHVLNGKIFKTKDEVVPSGSGIPERSFDLDALRKCKSYSDLAFQIFRKFISAEEIPDKDLG